MKRIRYFLILIALSILILSGCRNDLTLYLPDVNDIPEIDEADEPINVILFIGDGMGPQQIKAGGMWQFGFDYLSSAADSWSFESFPIQTKMRTWNAWGGITDSAASATAMATGSKVNNGVLSLEIPGSGGALLTLGEMAKADGKSVGLISTDNVLGATPAAFAVHQASRNDYSEIADQMMVFYPNLIFGGGKALSSVVASGTGYSVEDDPANWDITFPEDMSVPFHVFGRFGEGVFPYVTDDIPGYPSLYEMTEKALSLLDNDTDGFFLLIENGLTDKSGHLNDIAKLVEEVDALDQAVEYALDWATARPETDTIIIVTADHETGGLNVLGNNGAGALPTVSWSTPGHTSVDVDLYAWGKDSGDFGLVRENIDIFRLISRYYK